MPEYIYTICADPGHGGSDPGACGNNLQEKTMNLNTYLGFKEEMDKYNNVNVISTRTDDRFIELSERCNIAKRAKANVFISLHHNSGGGDRAEFIYPVGRDSSSLDLKIVYNLKQIFDAELGQQIKSYHRAGSNNSNYYAVIRGTADFMASIIVETCFIDNINDVQIANTVDKQKRNGKLIATAVAKALGLSLKSTKQSTASLSYGEAASEIAKLQVGKKYVYGTNGPQTFDCSGLIDYCFRQAGYTGFKVSRETTSTLQKEMVDINYVDFKDLKPGDLIFPKSGHVVMYVGDGFTVEAECDKTGVVKKSISKFNKSTCVLGRLYGSSNEGGVIPKNISIVPAAGYREGTYQKNVRVTADSLNIRSGRGSDFAILGSLPKGTVVNVWYIGKSKEGSLWGSCNVHGKTGYICMSYTTPC